MAANVRHIALDCLRLAARALSGDFPDTANSAVY
jgi:hypothetical protein